MSGPESTLEGISPIPDMRGRVASVLAVVDREVFTAEWTPEIEGECAREGRGR